MFGKSKKDPQAPKTSRRVRVLAAQLDEARDVHRLAANPLLGAVNADRFRVSITRTMWFFLAVGLGFTTTGVHDFLAGHLTAADPMWWGGWLAEPALAGILITLLRWEAAMLVHGLDVDHRPVKWLKRVLLASTLIANVWAALAPSDGRISKGNVFFHLVIPTVVFLLAEVMPIIQAECTKVREQAAAEVPHGTEGPRPAAAPTAPTGTHQPGPPLPSLAPDPAPASRVKLPPEMTGRITAALDAARAEGRTPTTADIRAVVKIPEPVAAQVLADHAPRNGHTLTH
ncbi:hypothetical protein [Amycolatopsis sp. 195334CR]|uniref:hypothetical protein n=1 Tax=Amycolatopsis sp. 195334CR TaxID=2814588 RepID=UPI001A908D4E|nr:hypothetical protein [Amycolatopsis sp. 195334CR]MBN6039126.1 hypothetical protein [Amycolatopsis sp. 195334CR]